MCLEHCLSGLSRRQFVASLLAAAPAAAWSSLTGGPSQGEPVGGALLIRDARIFDGRAVIPVGSALIEKGRIKAVGRRIKAPRQSEVIDGRGKTLLPGLIDSHTHTFEGDLEQALVFGVTTELEMGGPPERAAMLKARAATSMAMADLRSACNSVTVPGGHPIGTKSKFVDYSKHPTLKDPAQAAQFAADRLAEGADYLKIIIEDGSLYGPTLPTLPPEAVAPLVKAAHERQRLAIAHATEAVHARIAIEAGVDGLAHVYRDRPPDGSLVKLIAASGAFVCPTLTAPERFFGRVEPTERLIADPKIAPYLNPKSLQFFKLGPFAPGAIDLDIGAKNVAELKAAGVTILAGSDAPNPGVVHGLSLHHELEALVGAGLSPTEALTAATATPAARFSLKDRGRIAPGLRADLLLVEGDPTTKITDTLRIVAIWRGGARLDREAYRRSLAAAPKINK